PGGRRAAGAALAPGLAGLLGGEAVRGAAGVCRTAPLAPGLAGFFGGEAVGGPLGVGGFSALAGDGPLFFRIHGGKAPCALVCHDWNPFASGPSNVEKRRSPTVG